VVAGVVLAIGALLAGNGPVFAVQPTPTPLPMNLAQMLAPDCPARYASGAQQLTVQQSTRIQVTCTVTNRINEPVMYSAMTFTLGERVAVVGGDAQAGQVAVVGNQIRWTNVSVAPGQSATASATIEVTPAPADAGRTLTLFTGVTTMAQTQSGSQVSLSAGPVPSTVVSGLGGGGIVQAPGAAQPVATPAPGAQRPAAPAAAPRTGTGTGTAGDGRALPAALGLALAALGAAALSVRALSARRRAR